MTQPSPLVVSLCWIGPGEPRLPRYATPGSAGLDLEAALEAPHTLQPGERALIPTGLQLQIPPGFEGQVRPRSGLALHHGLTLLNSPGTIDSDYRGEIGVLLINLSQQPYTIEPWERIAQLVFAPIQKITFKLVPSLETSLRHEGGFGSTGR